MSFGTVALSVTALVMTPALLRAQAESTAGHVEQVEFRSADGLTLYADLQRAAPGAERGIIVLFHQAGSNARGEYSDIIPRLVENGFSALAVDLRAGGSRYGSENRTVRNAGLPESRDYCAVYPDLLAAWQYVMNAGFEGPRFAWGSSFSAALVLRLAVERADEMQGVLAFSPASGEPMEGCRPEQYLDRLTVPALVLRPEAEASASSVVEQLRRFESAGHETHVARPGAHGSSMLSASRVERGTEESWRVVLEFLRAHSTAGLEQLDRVARGVVHENL